MLVYEDDQRFRVEGLGGRNEGSGFPPLEVGVWG